MRDSITAIKADLGPSFYGFYGIVDDTVTCVVTPQVEHDATARDIVRGLIRRQGGDCYTCGRCLVGQGP